MKFLELRPFAGLTVAVTMLVSLCVAPTGVHAQAAVQKNVNGGVVVDGKKTALHHAYALTQPARKGDQAYTIVLLTDKPLPAELLFERFEETSFTAPSGTQLVEVWLDQLKRTNRISFNLESFFGDAEGPAYKSSFDTFSNDVLKGRIYVESAQKQHDKTFTIDVQFNTALLAPRAPDLTGKAAWDSPQGRALAAYLRALQVGDKAAIRRVITANAAKQLDEPGSAEQLKLMKMFSPLPADLATFDSLRIYGNVAKARLSAMFNDVGRVTSQHDLRRVGNVWLVEPSRY